MRRDWLGNTVTASSDATLSGIDDFIDGFLGYENKAVNVIAAADNDPESCLANAYSALCFMFLESRDAPSLAKPYLKKAEAAAASATRREQMTTAVVRAWADGDIRRTIELSHEVAKEFPRDLPIVKQAQYHYFNLGNPTSMLSIAEPALEHNADVPYIHGMAAFAYEQSYLLEDAEAEARKAIAMKRKEPWAHHALAHVLIMQGRIGEGVEFLTGVADTWTDLNSFMVTHNWWHLALNYIAQGRYAETLKLYDDHVWGVNKVYSQDQIGAASLLMRLELVGVDVGDRWKDLGEYLKPRVDDFVQPFLSMQYLYGLARARLPEADQLMDNLSRFAATAPALTREAWGEVCVTACEGLRAHARGDYETAFRRMALAVPRLLEIGGSHAQRGLFDQVLLDSMIRTGRYAQAQQMLERDRAHCPGSKPINTALVEVYRQLGLNREAAQARARLAEAA